MNSLPYSVGDRVRIGSLIADVTAIIIRRGSVRYRLDYPDNTAVWEDAQEIDGKMEEN